jgi:hypothetical protein
MRFFLASLRRGEVKASSCLVFRGRVSPRRATYFSLLRQRKVGKRKATLLSASLRFATGNLRCSTTAGVRRTRFAQTAAALIPPTSALLGAARRDWGTKRAIAALGANGAAAQRLRHIGPSEAKARVGSSSHPSGCAEERSVSRIRARSCLSEASSARPRETRAPQVARSEAEGRRQWGRLFFAYFLLAKQKKVSPPPGGYPGPGKQTKSKVQKGASQ